MVHLNEIHRILRIQSYYEVALTVGEWWCPSSVQSSSPRSLPDPEDIAIRSIKTSATGGTTSQET